MRKILGFVLAFCLLCPSCLAAGGPGVSASSAILMDAQSGRILYEKDAYTRRSIASTTKLLTALVAVESTPDLSRVVTITADHWAEGTSMYLKPGEEVTLEDLLYGLLLQSGNDAALAIATGCAGNVETFVEWMNQWAADLGMENSHFANPNGLDDEDHYSTAYDMALLARAVLENKTLSSIVATRSATKAGRSLSNHNKLLWQYEGCNGMKTGYTTEAGRTLVSSATRNGQTLICVTLNAPNDWADHRALLDYGFEEWPLRQLVAGGKMLRMLPVTGSLIPQVQIMTAADAAYPLSAQEQVRVTVTLPETVSAPLSKGEAAGKMTFFLGEQVIGETELIYGAEIPENRVGPTLAERIREFLFQKKVNASLAVMGYLGLF
ncbi:MAG: D-alanyl-D-alanine carboxypeptidase [Oscillospiraceae bacterium]|nr:D-alanyl-D-alanine carboxypeptidase [Oscillospiraceae bacterium]